MRPTPAELRRHWVHTSSTFRSEWRSWRLVFWDLMAEISDVLGLLEHRRKLAENCSYLLLSKSANHSLA